MEMISDIIEDGMRETGTSPEPKCPSCRNILSVADLSDIDIATGTNNLFATIECKKCRCHIILSPELIERIRNNEQETTCCSE